MIYLTDQHVAFGKAQRAFLLCLCLGFMVLVPSLVHAAALGVPGDGTNLSGVGVISGWKCEAEEITVEFLNAAGQRIVINEGRTSNPVPVLYGSERPDVLNVGACASADVGFVAIWNWGELGDGTYTAVAYDNDVEFARNTFTVTTPGDDFVEGVSKEVTVEDFPHPGDTTVLEWNQGTQHFEIVEVDLLEDPLASYDRAYWRKVRRDIATGTYASKNFLYASTPDLNSCTAGALTQKAKDRALEGMNQIRALHGLADVRYSSQYDTSVKRPP